MPRKATKTTTEKVEPKAARAAKATPKVVEAAPVSETPKAPAKVTADRKKLYEECRKKLLKAKEEHLAHFDQKRAAISEHIGGDDGDVANLAEEQDIAVSRRENLLQLLSEIETALERMEEGTYGICEETGEVIESERLRAIPWTRLSLEGAISREKEEKELQRRRA